MICINCGKDTSEKFTFCEHCYQQIRCCYEDCGAPLKPGAPICLMCGRNTGPRQDAQPIVNMYEEDVKQTADSYESHRRLQVNTEAVAAFAPFVTSQIQSRTAKVPFGTDGSYIDRPELLLPAPAPSDNNSKAAQEQPYCPVRSEEPAQTNDLVNSLFDVIDDDKLIAKERDFKGISKKEQQKRLVVLYGWAYNALFGHAVPAKDHFKLAADKAQLYDNNFKSAYLSQSIKEFYNDLGNGSYKLNNQGTAKAAQILAEIEDSSKTGFKYWESTQRGAQKRASLNENDMAMVNEWMKMPVDHGKMDLRDLSNACDCALFALWAIIVHLNVADSVKPCVAYRFLKNKCNIIPVTTKAFSTALSRKYNKKYFRRTADGLYCITPDGQNEVEAWRNGQSIGGNHKKGSSE